MSRFFKFLFLVPLTMVLLSALPAQAAEFTCGTDGVNNSCTPSGLTSLIGSASEDDIIRIASGTHSWSSAVTLNKNVTITGLGYCPDCGTENPTGTWTWPAQLTIGSNGAFRIDSSDRTGLARITGLYINGHGPNHSYSGGADAAIIVVRTNNLAPYRVDNIRFNVTDSGSFTCIRHNTCNSYGVWDHIYMYSDITGITSDFAEINGYTGDNGDTDWTRSANWGGPNNTYVEDTTIYFENPNPGSPAICFDQQGGGRTVVRNSYLRNCQSGNHGTESGWPQRSGVTNEYYNNTFEWTYLADKLHTAFLWRGGSLYFHNNVVKNFQAMVKGSVYRVSNSYGCGTCGSANCEDIDGMFGSPYPQGYPCIDQQGRGAAAGVGLYNTQPQAAEKSHIWNNTLVNVDQALNLQGTYIAEGRDYEYSTDNSAAPVGYSPLVYPHPLWVSDLTVPGSPRSFQILGEP